MKWLIVVAALGMAACQPQGQRPLSPLTVGAVPTYAAGGASQPAPPSPVTAPEGLVVQLSAAQRSGEADEPAPTAQTQPLTAQQVASLVARLPALPTPPTPPLAWAWRGPSQAPPRPGADDTTVVAAFAPPPVALPAPSATVNPLQVLRIAPSGDVAIAPRVSVTFSQPMVALASQADLARAPVPVQLSPQPPGTWQWQGTQTAVFQPRERLPMASDFTVKVAAGTRSATGGVLDKAVESHVRTALPEVVSMEPQGDSKPIDAWIWLQFNQDIDPAAVAKVVAVTAQGKPVATRLLDPSEVAAQTGLEQRVRALQADGQSRRWMVLRPLQPLPKDATVVVRVGPAVPSAEGPRTQPKAASFGFRTFAALRLVEQRCGWRKTCPPLAPWALRFNNLLDSAAFDASWVRIEPPVADAQFSISGNTLWVHGATRGNTRYTIHIDARLRDVFGQTLAAPLALSQVTGPAEPGVVFTTDWLTVVDPYAARPTLPVWTVNHAAVTVKMWQVLPKDWPQWLAYVREGWRSDRGAPRTPPGRLAVDTVYRPQAPADTPVQSQIDLSPALQEGLGHAIVRVEVPSTKGPPQRFETWVQVTQLGLTAVADRATLQVLVTGLRDGKAAAEASVRLFDGSGAERHKGVTGPDGTASLPLPAQMRGAGFLVATRGRDEAILAEAGPWQDNSGWQADPAKRATVVHMVNDRGLYRPGETVHCKGWLRTVQGGPLGDVSAFAGAKQAHWRATDAVGNPIARGSVDISATSAFTLQLALPKDVHLGEVSIDVGLDADALDHHHAVRVEEFRRPEFESTTTAAAGPHVIGGHALVTTAARYFAGGSLAGADVNWEVATAPATFAPPGHEGWTFGDRPPWWMWRGGARNGRSGASARHRHAGRLSAAGEDGLRIDFARGEPVQPWAVTATATVHDVNRQAWSSSAALLVHPALVYAGLKLDQSFAEAGRPLKIGVLACDIDGHLTAGKRVQVQMARLVHEQVRGAWQTVRRDAMACEVVQGERDVGSCVLQPPRGGLWHLEATTHDDSGRSAWTVLPVFVAGRDAPPDPSAPADEVRIVADKQQYAPGDTANLLLLAPWPDGEGELTWARDGRVQRQHLRFEGQTATVKLAITDAYTPGLWAHVVLAGQSPRTEPADTSAGAKRPMRPAHAHGATYLSVPPRHRTLAVAVEPAAAETTPGAKTWLDVTVRNARGEPVQDAEVLVVMADEAVLALTGYRLADPLATFYRARSHGLDHAELRKWLLLQSDPSALGDAAGVAETMAAPSSAKEQRKMAARAQLVGGALMDDGGDGSSPAIALRSDFNPLAVFAPAQRTAADGRTRVHLTLPGNLTRYRVMVIAAHGSQHFGQHEATVTARLPLMVKPSPPRFARSGDQFELPVVLQNQTAQPLAVQLAARASLLKWQSAVGNTTTGLQVTVPPLQRVEVRLPATAPVAGQAHVQLAVTAGNFSDAAALTLPIWTPATRESHASYGVLDAASGKDAVVLQPLRVPQGVAPQYGGLQVTTTSTALQGLSDAVLYLIDYPYGCSEQIASRVMAVAALRDVLTALGGTVLPAKETLDAAMARDLAELAKIQNEDGSFGFWKRGDRPWPVLGIHVAHALFRAAQKGYATPESMRQRSLSWLRQIDRHLPQDYPPAVRLSLRAQALYVRLLAGDRDAAKAKAMLREPARLQDLPLEAVGWLWPVLTGDASASAELAAIRAMVANRVEEQAGFAHFTTSYADGAHLLLASDRRTDAVLLDALMTDQPQSDLIAKLAQGLLAHRKRGRWASTQENAWVLLALDRYFRTYEKAEPDFVARLWVGDSYAGETAFRGRSTARKHIEVPMAQLQGLGAEPPVTLAKSGPGRLYYRLGLDYAIADPAQAAVERGFQVSRHYEAVDDPRDVITTADGSVQVRAGARVRVKVTMVNAARRYHVALVDPLPAGFEPIQAELQGSEPPAQPATGAAVGRWWSHWHEHDNLRDDRAEAFASLLWEGEWSYSYLVRATTPGTFVVPAAKAEEMYSPEVWGRSGSTRVIVSAAAK